MQIKNYSNNDQVFQRELNSFLNQQARVRTDFDAQEAKWPNWLECTKQKATETKKFFVELAEDGAFIFDDELNRIGKVDRYFYGV